MLTESLEEQIETLKSLYPLYKEEVYRRRNWMMSLTALGSGYLLLLLFSVQGITPQSQSLFLTLVAIGGVVIFSVLLIYLILQQRDRHRMAKQTLIEIERRLGLYQEDLYLDHNALYPPNWQTAWLSDRSVLVYIGVLTTLMILVIVATMLHHFP